LKPLEINWKIFYIGLIFIGDISITTDDAINTPNKLNMSYQIPEKSFVAANKDSISIVITSSQKN